MSDDVPSLRDLRKPPRRFSDEAIAAFRLARWMTSRVWPGKAAYRRYLARGGLETVEVDLPLRGVPAAWDGLRIVQISDLHGGVFVDEASLEPVVATVRSLRPDLLAITGDFVMRFVDDFDELGALFARLPARLGAFAVFGNHDYRERREHELAARLRRQRVTVLQNASAAVEYAGATLRVVGLDDIEESRGADLELALADARRDDAATLLLCHHPDVVDALPAGRFDLVLSGHSHGGQIVLPGVGSLGRRWMPRRLRGTHDLDGGGRLHVNRGVGVLVLPFRLGARAEVSCVTVRRVDEVDPAAAGR